METIKKIKIKMERGNRSNSNLREREKQIDRDRQRETEIDRFQYDYIPLNQKRIKHTYGRKYFLKFDLIRQLEKKRNKNHQFSEII